MGQPSVLVWNEDRDWASALPKLRQKHGVDDVVILFRDNEETKREFVARVKRRLGLLAREAGKVLVLLLPNGGQSTGVLQPS